jgi:outer membrane protein TolC
MRSQWRVEQMFPFPGTQGLKDDIAELSAQVAGQEAQTLELDLLFHVKQAYYELYRIQRHEELIRAFQNRLESFAEAAAVEYEVGEGMQQAILKAQLEKNTLSQRLINLDQQRQTAIETLSRLTNEPIPSFVRVDEEGDRRQTIDYDGDTLLAVALDRRPEVHALDAAAKRAESQVELADKNFWPDFGINVTYFDIADSDIPPTADGRNALAIGASVKIPLWRGGLTARRDEAQLRQLQVEARQEALRTSFRTGIADLLSRLRQDERQLDLFKVALIPQAETTLEATLSAYTTGRTDFLDLLDAERMLFSLGTGYEDTLARYLKAGAALERALGIRSLRQLESS